MNSVMTVYSVSLTWIMCPPSIPKKLASSGKLVVLTTPSCVSVTSIGRQPGSWQCGAADNLRLGASPCREAGPATGACPEGA